MSLFNDNKKLLAKFEMLTQQVAALRAERNAYVEAQQLDATVRDLRERVEKLKIERSTLEEKNAREERELRHMIGLEKKRQEFEIESARRETTLQVQEGNLKAERERFEADMKFRSDRFDSEVGYLKDLMGQILDRLPQVDVSQRITRHKEE